MRTIYASKGLNQYMGGTITETFGKDITGSSFAVALVVSDTEPPDKDSADWLTPDVNAQGATVADRILKLDITELPPTGPGRYQLLAKIGDDPENIPIPLDQAELR